MNNDTTLKEGASAATLGAERARPEARERRASGGIAIVGIGCRYPEANTPQEFWENILSGRRSFRQLPRERTDVADYSDDDRSAPDKFYGGTAAVLGNYEFDRLRHRVGGTTYRSTDLTHWLALDVASDALTDAGFPGGEGLPSERTSVIMGNTLTGEFTRAGTMRLRWPYVRRVVGERLQLAGWSGEDIAQFMHDLEAGYKAPFPEVTEDSLAGGLSNTIAGRICNHFDLHGGGFTVDGACSSSLLSVATASASLIAGDVDVALAGGVDLSLDPFELVGFAKTGALSSSEMRLYDRKSNGFWPGEGCGLVVLMREEDARRAGKHIYAVIAGWGISSDGQGGITRPEVAGYQLAMRRAYEQAGWGPNTIGYFEGHGTGTEVGDRTELSALIEARRNAGAFAAPAAVGSVKGSIGHTKAAAGVAGLIKAALALNEQIIPPTVGCQDPHELLEGPTPTLRVLDQAESWPEQLPLRAAVSSMGFGGINTHVALTAPVPRGKRMSTRSKAVAATMQTHELIVFEASTIEGLSQQIEQVAHATDWMSIGEMRDLAGQLEHNAKGLTYRACCVARMPKDLAAHCQELLRLLGEWDGQGLRASAGGGAYLAASDPDVRIGLLFPGQGGQFTNDRAALRRRFADIDDMAKSVALPPDADHKSTAVAQPQIVAASLSGLRALEHLCIDAHLAMGHSLGELTALHWAGSWNVDTLWQSVLDRGAVMAESGVPGSMASVFADEATTTELIAGLELTIAGYNSPTQHVVAGSAAGIQQLIERAAANGTATVALNVTRAFHSPLVEEAASRFAHQLTTVGLQVATRPVCSTVTGQWVTPDTDLRSLLRDQIVQPVRFQEAVEKAAADVDLFLEVGPGRVCTGLVNDTVATPTVALDTTDSTDWSLLTVAGAAWVAGAAVDLGVLFHGRALRSFDLTQPPTFLSNPCESAPNLALPHIEATEADEPAPTQSPAPSQNEGEATVNLVRRLVAEKLELPLDAVRPDSQLLDQLHLSSITIGQLMARAAKQRGVVLAQGATNFATATVQQLADTLDYANRDDDTIVEAQTDPLGAATWAGVFELRSTPSPDARRVAPVISGAWRVVSAGPVPEAEELRSLLVEAELGDGLVVWSLDSPEADFRAQALSEIQSFLASAPQGRLVVVQHGTGLGGLVKTVHHEYPSCHVTLIEHSGPAPRLVLEEMVKQVTASSGYRGVRIRGDEITQDLLVPVFPGGAVTTPLDPGDVLLVTGGGRGITAECALDLAQELGLRLGIIGRGDPNADQELAINLARMKAAGLEVAYASADVVDPSAVGHAVAQIESQLGPVKGLLHGAGSNRPTSIAALDAAELGSTYRVKVDGFRNVVAALAADDLSLVVSFGSIIGRAGLKGEAHYALANEALTRETLDFAEAHPQCRVRAIEWSVWSGAGMGESLNVIEQLSSEGITAISLDQGLQRLRELVMDPHAPSQSIVCGRSSGIKTIEFHREELPLLRYLERPLVHYPGMELITECELSAASDPYLTEHEIDGNLLLPAVLGMEAMAQVSIPLVGDRALTEISDMRFSAPIVVAPDASLRIQVAATRLDVDTVLVAVRSEATNFLQDHMVATLHYSHRVGAQPLPLEGLPKMPLDLEHFQGSTLFQGEMFHRLIDVERAGARDIIASLDARHDFRWFSELLPQTLLLGDPGLKDAVMHLNQMCIPHLTLLPVSIDSVHVAAITDAEPLRLISRQVKRHGDQFIYEAQVIQGDRVVQTWSGLKLQTVGEDDENTIWDPVLLGPYLARKVEAFIGAEFDCVVVPDAGSESASGLQQRRESTQRAAAWALGRTPSIRYRPDGKPETDCGSQITAAHASSMTMVCAEGPVGCDLEVVAPREDWGPMLGERAPLVEALGKSIGRPDEAATMVWSAVECLTKAGFPNDAPLTLAETNGRWTRLTSGQVSLFGTTVKIRGTEDPMVAMIGVEV